MNKNISYTNGEKKPENMNFIQSNDPKEKSKIRINMLLHLNLHECDGSSP